MDECQRAFVEIVAKEFRPTFRKGYQVLEIGSRAYGELANLRGIFPDCGLYLGIDRQDGPGVDIVWDAMVPCDGILGGPNSMSFANAFDVIVCMGVLEHVRDPGMMLDTARNCWLRSGGLFILGAVFNFPFHEPPDYWRYTPMGLECLLEDNGFEWIYTYKAGPENGWHTICALAIQDEGVLIPTSFFNRSQEWEQQFNIRR